MIAADLAAEFAKELDPLQDLHQQTYEQQRRAEESVKNLSMKLTSEYNSYLGKENLDIGMVDELIRIMEAGSKIYSSCAPCELSSCTCTDVLSPSLPPFKDSPFSPVFAAL